MDRQLAETVAAFANAGGKDRQGEGVYIGKGLPPVPPKLAKKIRSTEYIEMKELLPEVCTQEVSKTEVKQRCLRWAIDFFTWLQCYRVYMSIRGAQFSELIPELIAHMSTIYKSKQGIRRPGVDQIRHTIPQTRSTKERNEVVSD